MMPDTNLTLAQADEVLRYHPMLMAALVTAMYDTDVSKRHIPTATRSAAYLGVSGWLTRQREICGYGFGGESEADYAIRSAKEAVTELQTAGIVASGVFSCFFIHWVLIPFLQSLIVNWLWRAWDDERAEVN